MTISLLHLRAKPRQEDSCQFACGHEVNQPLWSREK